MASSGRRRNPGATRLAVVGLFGAIIAAMALPGPAPVAPAAAADGPVAVVATPATVSDGQSVSVTIKSAATVTVTEARVRICRTGVTYQTSAPNPIAPAPDFAGNGPNCPSQAISSSAQDFLDDSAISDAGTTGETFLFRVGAGVVQWDDPSGSGKKLSLTCGPGNPCALVVEVLVQDNSTKTTTWVPFSEPLTYAADDPFGGCGGPADGVLSSGGSDRMSEAWVSWTTGECRLPGRAGSASRATFVGEGDSVQSFSSGALDLTYSAGGYDQQMGFAPPDPALPNGGRRRTINVPIAVNAAVFAVGGGAKVHSGRVPYVGVKLTLPEVAGFLTAGGAIPFQGEQIYDKAITTRNPLLTGAVFDQGGAGTTAPIAGATAGPDAASWYMTRLLTTVVPDAWRVPDDAVAGADRGKGRGISNALAQASPQFVSQELNLVSGRPPIRKRLADVNPLASGGIWFLTDLETANALGMTPVLIESHPGSEQFVGPTPDTMAAALRTMVADQPDSAGNTGGVLIAPASPPPGTAAYPLTMVEYALAPAEPLINTDCTTRDKSQALLTGWLKYITGPAGQAALPPGMIPLNADLQATATKAISMVGSAPTSGDCAGKVNVHPSGATTTVAPRASPRPTTGVSGSSGRGANTAGVASGGNPSPGGATSSAGAGIPADVTSTTITNLVAIPAFAGRGGVSYVSTVVALLGIVALSALAALGRRARRAPDTG